MIRLHVIDDLEHGVRIPLGPEPSRYLLTVMRQRVGDALLVFNGRHGEWRAVVTEGGKRGAVLTAQVRTREQDVGPDLDLVMALIKRAPLETVVEKATELGVSRLRLVTTRRTQSDHVNLGRLQAIAAEAAEQTGRLDVPEIFAPRPLERLLEGWERGRSLIFCDEAGDAPPMLQAPATAPAAILIGPEGGFDPAEREHLRSLPFATPVSLGPRILRADTAAISALTLWQAAAGDWR